MNISKTQWRCCESGLANWTDNRVQCVSCGKWWDYTPMNGWQLVPPAETELAALQAENKRLKAEIARLRDEVPCEHCGKVPLYCLC